MVFLFPPFPSGDNALSHLLFASIVVNVSVRGFDTSHTLRAAGHNMDPCSVSCVCWLRPQQLYVWVFVLPFPRSPPPPLASVSARSSRPRRRRVRPPARPSASPALSSLPSLPPPSAQALRVVGEYNKRASGQNKTRKSRPELCPFLDMDLRWSKGLSPRRPRYDPFAGLGALPPQILGYTKIQIKTRNNI